MALASYLKEMGDRSFGRREWHTSHPSLYAFGYIDLSCTPRWHISLLTPTSYEVRGVTNLEKGGVWMTWMT